MDQVVLKRVTVADREQVQRIARDTYYETFAEFNSKEDMDKYLEEDMNLEKITKEIENPNSIFYLALENEVVIGYLKINVGDAQTKLQDPDALEIQRIYILKEYQGKKIGQILFAKALEITKKGGYQYVWLCVWERNTRAISFYNKNGFVEFDKMQRKIGSSLQIGVMMKLMI